MNKNTQSTSTLSRQKKLITVLAFAAAVVAIVYIAIGVFVKDPLYTILRLDEDGDEVFATISDGKGDVTKSSIEKELALGKGPHNVKKGQTEDVLYTFRAKDVNISYRPFITPEIPLEQLFSVTVENESGKFTIKRDPISDEFVFEEAPLQTYNSQLVSRLLFQARYMLAIEKTSHEGKDLSAFGLDENSNPVKITVSDNSGKTSTVLFGNLSVTGNSYYMKHTDKPFIYLMDTSAEIFKNPLEFYIAPSLAKSISETESAYIETFVLKKNGERFFECEIIPEKEREGTSSTNLHRTTYPANYTPSSTEFYASLTKVGSIIGESVVEINVSASPDKQKVLAKYGLDKPANQVEWTYNGEKQGFITSELVDDSFYFAYSEYMDTIVTLPSENAPFLEFGLIDFIDDYAFRSNITNITEIIVNDTKNTCVYLLEHKDKDLIVTESTSGKVIDTPSFRQFFLSILNLKIGGYADVKTPEGLDKELSLTIKTKFGETYAYEFYTLSTMRSFMTLSGTGEFYADRNLVNSCLEKNGMLVRGETIVADYR